MSLKIPHPTPTPSPVPTQTLAPNQATEQACPRDNYTVQSGDTLTGIARAYNVGTQAIMDYNNMANDSVFAGQILVIPLCKRNPTPGPTPTPTTPPPYPAPNLLLPRDGDRFTQADDTVTLQWASVGPLRDNEAYQITIEDISDVTGSVRLIAQATDTKYIVPTSFRPADVNPHILRWWVAVVRQTDTDVNGNPVYTTAGAASAKRDFTWSGAPPIASPTPAA
jgi:murein DD-endopeptidase MepM/ murein hydrolase activator NlpD